MRRELRGKALAVLGRLDFYTDERETFLFRLHNSNSFSIQIQQIVRKAMPAHEGKISEDHAPPGMKICALVVLNSPASLFQRLVDVLARLIFRSGHGAKNTPFLARKHLARLGKF